MKHTPPSDQTDWNHVSTCPAMKSGHNIIQHYVRQFHDHGMQTSSVKEAKAWVAGTAGATTRREKMKIWRQTHGSIR